MKNKFNFKSIILTLTLLTLGVGQVGATDYYFRHWDANNSTQLVDQGSNIYSSYFILNGSISFKISDASWTNANTFGKNSSAISLNSEYSCASPGSDFSLNFSTNRAYLVRFNASASTKKLLISTFVPSAAAPSAVVSGTNAMFYIQGYEGLNYLANSSKTKASNSYPMNYTGISYVNTAKSDLSTYDYITNNPGSWVGDEATNIKSATGGELITRANAKTAAKTASTTASVTNNVLSISTTTNSTTGVYGSLPLYIQYYIDGTFVGVTYSASTASYGDIPAGGATARASTYNVSELTTGNHTLKTVLTDGIIFWVADTDNFEVTPASTATLTYHANWYTTGTSGSVPAAQTVAVDATATVAGKNTLAMTNYTFSGWNTEEYITGTDYAVGSSITMDEDKDLYAKWTRSITLNQNGATTNGTTSVTGTYNCSTLPSITNPEKLGYTFVGWRTENNGTGNLVINTSGQLQSNVYHWTDQTTPSNRFQRYPTSTSPLYATWTQNITLNANTSNHGSGTNKTAAVTYNSTALTSITHCTPATGYKVEGYYTATTDGTKILNADGTFAASSITNYITSSKWTKAGATTLYAHYEPKTTVRLYYSNPDNWSTVYAYVWENADGNNKNNTWHGVNITGNTLVRNGDTYYYYEYYKEDHPNWDRVIFNNNDNNQTNNITFSNTTNNGQYNDAVKDGVGSWHDMPAEETLYSVTFYAGDHGAINAKGTAIAKNGSSSVNIGATARALIATPESGYSFDKWVTTGSVTVTDQYSASTTVSASAAGGTVRAHYLANSGWYLQGGFDNYDTWETTAKALPVDRPYRGISGVYYRPFSTLDNDDYFGLHDGTNKYSGHESTSSDYNYSSLDQVATLYVNSSKSFQAKTSFSNKWAVINTTGTKTFWIQNPETCHTVTVSNDGAKGTVVLKTDNHGNLTTTQFTNGETIRVEIDTMAHYSIASVTLGATNIPMTHSSGTKYTGTAVMPNNDVTLTVTYTPCYTIHYERVPAAGGKTAPWANTSGNINDKTIISDATDVRSGTTVYLYAANRSDGYTYYGWYSVNNPGKEDTSKRLTESQSYSTSISTSGKEFYAIYFENDYTVKMYNNGNGDVYEGGSIVTSTTAHVATASNTLTATPQTGYYFTSWDQFSDSLTINSPSTASTTIKIKSNKLGNNARLRANYSPRWAIVGNYEIGGWSNFTQVLDDYEVVSSKDKGYREISLLPNKEYEFKVYDKQEDGWYGYASGSNTENQIHYANSNTEKAVTTATGNRNLYLYTAAGGTYTFKWNLTDKKIAVEYPTSWYITTGQKTTGQADNAGGSFTAVDNSSNDVKGGKFVANNATVTFTATPNTGYNFVGWYSDASCETAYVNGTGGAAISGEGGVVLTLSSITADKTVYAKFTPKNYNVALDMQSGAEGYGSGSNRNETVTYNTTLTTVGSLPTAANGYAFMGFYSAEGGKGTPFINASGTWATSVPDTIADSKWVLDAGATLYAYYKKAEITNLVLSASTMAPNTSVTATPTISPTPVGPTLICWKILRSNGNLLTKEGFSDAGGNAVSFSAPETSGSYKVACVLRTGSDCDAGTVLDSVTVDFVVAGAHVVTVRYQDGDGRTLAASTSMEGRPLDWSGTINPPTVIGYTFDHWVAGDGVTMSTDGSSPVGSNTTTTATIYIKASYDGNLTAVYTKKNMIYFNNTLGWSDVYVYFYTSGKYWANDWGTGAYAGKYFDGQKPYENKMHGHMTQIEGTNIWYFDYTAAGYSTYANVAFANMDKSNDGTDNTSNNDLGFFSNTTDDPIQVARRGDHKSSLPMFVPLAGQPKTKLNNSKAEYSNQGYWMNYPENTGYTLKIYNTKTKDTPDELQSIPFKFTADMTMPMELTVELNANREYGFEIHRADGEYFGYDTKVLKINASGDEGESSLAFTGTKRTGIQTSVAGEYIFRLNYGDISSVYNYLVGVHYPVAVNDYRIIYKDNATWSNGEHGETWYHPSRAIHKENGAEDIVSFYISKADGASASMTFQYASAIDANGVVTWTDVASGGSIDLSGITESGVYNFYLKQSDGTISVDKIEAYTGNYYIRTDLAGTSGWDNYRATDHLMTYSEFSKSRETNKFGELYTHYYMKWCERGKNVKFVIANNYSSCVSDTLESDLVDLGNLSSGGWLKSDGAADPTSDKYSANIRFMYDERTNKVSRAYMSSSTNTARQFLVLKGNANFWNSDGTNLTGSGESHANHEAIFKDNEDWIYERMIKLTPGSLFKLYACYAQADVSENGAQHFRGTYADGAFTKDVSAIELIGGEGSTCNARIIYDFKTNRLIAAYLPDGSDIDGTQAIKADLMMVREHQGAGQQLTFKDGDAKLTDVYTVYGVMRFNRWILNNRANPTDYAKDHSDTDAHISEYHPLLDAGSQKSIAERGLYWISFPFDVNLSEVFGFGTYGTHWIMMRYNGKERARIGYWKDNEEGFWEYIWDRKGVTLEAGQGYVLALELDLMAANDNTFWPNGIQQVELFFPSTASAGTIKQTNVDVTIPAHECTIDRRTDKTKPDWNKDRRVADSHWNIIGVPSYANYGKTLSNGSSTITWNTWSKAANLPFLYEWNANDNTYTVQSGTTYAFKAMHAYYVQYHGTLRWSLASATPSSIVARRTYADEPQSAEFRLELQQGGQKLDQTFVKLNDDEETQTSFVFGEDMNKEFNAGKANIYSFIEGYMPAAGNSLPMNDQTTVVPVGVKTVANGEYTFAMPEGTNGIAVTLIDNETGVRTNLGLTDYTVTLTAGTYDQRFTLEIPAISNTPTDIELINDENGENGVTGVRKVLIDNKLFIITEDGKVFDARGAMVKSNE